MLERLVELGRTGTYDHSAAFNPALMRELALLNLGSCYLRLGDPRKAEVCFAQSGDRSCPRRTGPAWSCPVPGDAGALLMARRPEQESSLGMICVVAIEFE